MSSLLTIKDLVVTVPGPGEDARIVDGISIDVPRRCLYGVVGGSGSGKTTTGLAILRLLSPALSVPSGAVNYKGENILTVPQERMRHIRGGEISMVFQEPLYAFNPVFTIGDQIQEVLKLHTRLPAHKRRERLLELLDLTGLRDPDRVAATYPHQLSGGMRQRAMIAHALAGEPKLLIADEPTSNLDVTLQARVIELFRRLNRELDLAIILITHDLGMVEHLCHRTAVMHQGKVVEEGKTADIMKNPQNAYTQKLIHALALKE